MYKVSISVAKQYAPCAEKKKAARNVGKTSGNNKNNKTERNQKYKKEDIKNEARLQVAQILLRILI